MENLCLAYKRMYSECLKLVHEGSIHSCWFYNAKIYVSIHENDKPISIFHIDELEGLLSSCYHRLNIKIKIICLKTFHNKRFLFLCRWTYGHYHSINLYIIYSIKNIMYNFHQFQCIVDPALPLMNQVYRTVYINHPVPTLIICE